MPLLNKIFFYNSEMIKNILKSCAFVTQEKYYEVYKDRSGKKFKYSVLWSDILEKDIYILEEIPPYTIEDMLLKLEESNSLEEISALSLLLFFNEYYKDKNNVTILINMLERLLIKEPEQLTKLKNIIYETHIFDPTNKAEIIGKNLSEIEGDFGFYKMISERAKKILNM